MALTCVLSVLPAWFVAARARGPRSAHRLSATFVSGTLPRSGSDSSALRAGGAHVASHEVRRIADDFSLALGMRGAEPDISFRGNQRWVETLRSLAKRLGRVRRSALSESDVLTHAMLAHELRHQYAIVLSLDQSLDVVGSLTTTIYDLLGVRRTSPSDWHWLLSRLERTDRWVADYVALLRSGLNRVGATRSRLFVRSVLALVGDLADTRPGCNPLTQFERQLRASVTADGPRRFLLERLRSVLREVVIPAHQKLEVFLREHYLPRAMPDSRNTLYTRVVEKAFGVDAPRLLIETQRAVRSIHRRIRKTVLRAGRSGDLLHRTMANGLRRPNSLFLVPASELETHQFSSNWVVETAALEELGDASMVHLASAEGASVQHPLYGVRTDLIDRCLSRSGAEMHVRRDAYRASLGLYAETMAYGRQSDSSPRAQLGFLVRQAWAAAAAVIDLGLHLGVMSPAAAREYLARATFSAAEDAAPDVRCAKQHPGYLLTLYAGQRLAFDMRRAVSRWIGPRFDEAEFRNRLRHHWSRPDRGLDAGRVKSALLAWASTNAKRSNASPVGGTHDDTSFLLLGPCYE